MLIFFQDEHYNTNNYHFGPMILLWNHCQKGCFKMQLLQVQFYGIALRKSILKYNIEMFIT